MRSVSGWMVRLELPSKYLQVTVSDLEHYQSICQIINTMPNVYYASQCFNKKISISNQLMLITFSEYTVSAYIVLLRNIYRDI